MNNTGNLKVITSVPGWTEFFASGGGQGNTTSAYATIPLVYRCTRMISDALSSVPVHVYKGEKEVDFPFRDFDVADWTWKTTASILLMGASYTVKVVNQSGKVLDLKWLLPTTVKPDVISTTDGDKTTASIIFKRTGNIIGGKESYSESEMLYIREFSMKDDFTPGISAAGVALTDANLIKYLTRFASYYFEQGAMPLTILSIDKTTQQAEVDRVENKFKSITQGLRNAWKVMVMRGGKDMAPFTITPPLSDMVMPELYGQARRTVAGAFGIPQSMLEDSANYATAKEDKLSFWQNAVKPRGIQLASALNKQVLKPMGLTCEYAFDEMDVFQEDEANRAGSLAQLTSAGVPLLIAMDILGYDFTEEQKAEILEATKKPEPVPPVVVNTPPVVDTTPVPPVPPTREAIRSALFNWKKSALAAVKTGHDADIDFDHPAIDEHVADRIHDGLKASKTADDIHALFKNAQEWTKGPDVGVDLLAELKRANDLLARELVTQ